MFKWALIFAMIAIASNFLGMNHSAELSTAIASISLLVGTFFYFTQLLSTERKIRSRRA